MRHFLSPAPFSSHSYFVSEDFQKSKNCFKKTFPQVLPRWGCLSQAADPVPPIESRWGDEKSKHVQQNNSCMSPSRRRHHQGINNETQWDHRNWDANLYRSLGFAPKLKQLGKNSWAKGHNSGTQCYEIQNERLKYWLKIPSAVKAGLALFSKQWVKHVIWVVPNHRIANWNLVLGVCAGADTTSRRLMWACFTFCCLASGTWLFFIARGKSKKAIWINLDTQTNSSKVSKLRPDGRWI